MRRSILWFVPLLVPLSLVILSLAWQAPVGLMGERNYSAYRPGDCLRTPVVNVAKLERWDEPPTPENIVMVTEVGTTQYRYREWGTRISRNPEWYGSYRAVKFADFDDATKWQPISCPEQGPDPEVAENVRVTEGTTFTTADPRNNFIECDQLGHCTVR